MYVFGSQEAVSSITKSMINASKEKLDKKLLTYFKNEDLEHDFVLVNSITLAGTHMMIIIKKKYAPYLSNITNDYIV